MNNRYRSKYKIKGPKFSNREVWNIGFVLARHIYKGLLQFKQSKRWGHPGSITEEEWETILDKMIWSFKEIKDDYPNLPYNIEFHKWYKEKKEKGEPPCSTCKTKNGLSVINICFDYTDELKARDQEYRNRVYEGKKLFAKYIEDLWD